MAHMILSHIIIADSRQASNDGDYVLNLLEIHYI